MKDNEMGIRIATRRKDLHLSQSQLAEQTGYSDKTAISKIEKGHSQLNQSKIVLFAHALKTTPAYLMGWVDDPDLTKEEIFERERYKQLTQYRTQIHRLLATASTDMPESLRVALAYDKAPQHIKDAIKTMLQIE